jgi:hypothetical protein
LISDLVTVPSARLNSAHGPELLPTTPQAADFLMPEADELITVINQKQRFRWKDLGGTSSFEGYSCMLAPAILSLLVGVALAQRFKVLVLVPAIMITLLFALVSGLARGDVNWTAAALIAVIIIVGLQIGYLLGIGVRHLLLLGRAHRLRAASPTRSLPQWRAR